MTDYNVLMKTLEEELMGQNIKVILDYLDSPNEIVFKDRLEDAFCITDNGNVKRVENTDKDPVNSLRLNFKNGEVTLSGYNLQLVKSRAESSYFLGDGLNRP